MASKICILDDDDAVRDSLCALLESYSYETHDFASARALLSQPDLAGFGCFIVDLHMPELNGLEVLETLRSRGISAPAVIVSAVAMSADAGRASKIGAVQVLAKPVPEAELIGWIRRALAGETALT
jgi:two-component system response regulator FixJ